MVASELREEAARPTAEAALPASDELENDEKTVGERNPATPQTKILGAMHKYMARFNHDFEELFDSEGSAPLCGLLGYSVLYIICIAGWSFLSILLWSSMFIGVGSANHPLGFLRENYWLSYTLCGSALAIFTSLYLLDFFMPPHLPGQYGALWNGDRLVGRALLAVALLMFAAGCLFTAQYYPNIPMMTFILLDPMLTAAVRHITRPKIMRMDPGSETEYKSIDSKVKLLKRLVGQSEDVLHFYKALTFAYLTTSLVIVALWVVQWVRGEICFQNCGNQYAGTDEECSSSTAEGFDSELVILLAISPLAVALANLTFGLFALLRVVLHRTYMATSRMQNELASDVGADLEALERRKVELRRKISEAGCSDFTMADFDGARNDPKAYANQVSQEFLSAEQKGMKQLTMLVKVVGFVFVVLLGLGYACALALWADSNIASMFVGLVGVVFVCFVIATSISFTRIAHELGNWLVDLPMWGFVVSVLSNDWMKAFLLCMTLVLFISPLALMSCVNQLVRRCRGIAGAVGSGDEGRRISEIKDTDTPARAFLKRLRKLLVTSYLDPEEARRFWFTARVQVAMATVRSFDWLSIYTKAYFWCILPFAYFVGSLLFNAMFSLLRHILSPVEFGIILVLTFLVGVLAFLWPTIPGMVVYMFGGLLVPDTCPYPSGADETTRFWVGAGINIVLGYCLKLSACAVQQKLIGERLGQNVKVRQMCRVHTQQMRTIESVLRKPGLSVGKVAILCGGPDWPVSVLCGILGLSLLQCEIGTLPIIFYVIPCAMCGSAYLGAAKFGGSWETAASAMVFLTTFVTGLLFVVITWALQREWEKNSAVLGAPLRQHADLWFLDHKAEELQRRCKVSWNELPRCLRNCFALGVIVQILVSHTLVLGQTYLLGSFTVSEPWENVVWLATSLDMCGCYTATETVEREHCIFAIAGVLASGTYLLAWIPYKALYRYWKNKNRKIEEELDKEFDESYERQWCEAFFKEHERPPGADSRTAVVAGGANDHAPAAAGGIIGVAVAGGAIVAGGSAVAGGAAAAANEQRVRAAMLLRNAAKSGELRPALRAMAGPGMRGSDEAPANAVEECEGGGGGEDSSSQQVCLPERDIDDAPFAHRSSLQSDGRKSLGFAFFPMCSFCYPVGGVAFREDSVDNVSAVGAERSVDPVV